MLTGKRILLAVSGGIAAYRAAELVRLLVKQGAEVRCVMTRSACEFITPMSLEALSGELVHTSLFDLTAEREMGHIRLARWADVLLVAPATADILARFAHGICDNLLTTIYQARRGPVLVAPAMNSAMWEAEATQRNVKALADDGVHFVGPAEGELACGESGPGRMSEPDDIIAALLPLLCEPLFEGQRWVINAGPTREPWDAVRVLSNRATGRLGALLADVVAAHGADVTLIAGPGTPRTRLPLRRVDVETAAQMLDACRISAAAADVFVASAAVSDYRFAEPADGKLKRGGEAMVCLAENPDIVAAIAAMDDRPRMVVAFAAESEAHIERARAKLRAKGVDAIFANDISRMGAESGGGWWLDGEDEHRSGEMDKASLAGWLSQRIHGWQEGNQDG